MRRVRIPLVDQNIPMVTLIVHTDLGATKVRFYVDTGADCTTIPVSYARSERIPFDETNEGEVFTVAGKARKFEGWVSVLIGGRAHEWRCFFTEPLTAGHRYRGAPVLGRSGFLDDYGIAIDNG